MIEESKIPLPKLSVELKAELAKSPTDYALNGGEDYELLFTTPAQKRHLVPPQIDGIPVHEIGKITVQRGSVRSREQPEPADFLPEALSISERLESGYPFLMKI